MKKVEILIGSPRKKGNTAFLAKHLAEMLDTKQYQVNYTYLGNLNSRPCTDCRGCKRGELNCVVQDDLQTVYPRLEEAYLIIFGTPIYWYTPSAQMKILLDRLRPYYGNQRLKGKKAASILPAGTGESDCQLTMRMFDKMFNALGLEKLGHVTSQSYDIGDASQDRQAIDQIKQLTDRFLAS